VFAGTRQLWVGRQQKHDGIVPALGDDAILESAAAILQRRLERLGTLTDPSAATEFLRMRLAGQANEVFYVLYLDNRHAILAAEAVFTGTIDQAEVHPRVIAKRALELNAAALICAHNHPSGNAEPSAADRTVTARLKQALALVDISLLDHFVVTAGSCTSLAARGWL
jgi:DNA repair protein RadC